MKTRILGLLAVGLLAGPMAAQAVPTAFNWTITASGFGAGAPQDPVTATVSFIADPDGVPVTGTASNFNLVIRSTTFTTAEFVTGTYLVIGSECDIDACYYSSKPAFAISILNWRTSPAFSSLTYVFDDENYYSTRTGTITNTAVPEPGTLAPLGAAAGSWPRGTA